MKAALLLLLSATVAWSYHVPDSYPLNTAAENQVNLDAYMQERYPIPEEAVAAITTHPEDEILAQSICTSIAGGRGWTYAVQRKCDTHTCTQLCTSQTLHNQDGQTKDREWFAIAAIHVYAHRPSSSPGTPTHPHIGLKVFQYGSVDAAPGCGPNWCCCTVPANI